MLGLHIGSCRVQRPLKKSRFEFFNKHKSTWFGRQHSPRQISEFMQGLAGEKPIVKADYLCSREAEVEFDFWNRFEMARRSFNDVGFFVIELSSLKTPVRNGRTIHSDHPLKSGVSQETAEQTDRHIASIMQVVAGRPVLFVSHFMHANVPNRNYLWKIMKRTEEEHDNVMICRPSDLWDLKTKSKFLKADDFHYLDSAIPKITEFIDSHIEKLLQNFSE